MNIESYLSQTEPAVRHLFNGLSEYDALVPPALVNYVDGTGQIVMSKEENDAFLNAHADSFALETARASLAGSILQIAYAGIKLYSLNKTVNQRCKELGVNQNNKDKLIPFCLGKEVKGIPEGLIIYAGRVQYNHWEDDLTNKVAKMVFGELARAYYNNPHFDMGYDLNYPYKRRVSHYIIRLELGWNNYDDYLNTLRTLLTSNCNKS